MKSRLCVAALAVMALVAASALRAADEAKLTCPVSGKPAEVTKTVDFNGGKYKVAFCCENCPGAFAANPDKFRAKTNLQLVQSKQLKQAKCPLTGRPMADDKSVDVAGVSVKVCCGNCLKKAQSTSGDEQITLLFGNPKPGSFEPAK